jgi:hypothetical protein
MGTDSCFFPPIFAATIDAMLWTLDPITQTVAINYPLLIAATTPVQQDQGMRNFNPPGWASWIRRGDFFLPSPTPKPSPKRIIAEFQAGHYLPAVALVASWGTMTRTKNYILTRPHQVIHQTIDQCAQSLVRTQSIAGSWGLLTGTLGWSNVMSAKTLHFLCRALGFTNDPPVPIDNKVILGNVWPKFIGAIPIGQQPSDWAGNSIDAYLRYMTAILTWRQRGWTTTDTEATIFTENE